MLREDWHAGGALTQELRGLHWGCVSLSHLVLLVSQCLTCDLECGKAGRCCLTSDPPHPLCSHRPREGSWAPLGAVGAGAEVREAAKPSPVDSRISGYPGPENRPEISAPARRFQVPLHGARIRRSRFLFNRPYWVCLFFFFPCILPKRLFSQPLPLRHPHSHTTI